MSSEYKVRQSRKNWKYKAVCRADVIRYFRRENERIKKERDTYRKEMMKYKKDLERIKWQNKTPVVQNKEELVFIALQLILVVRISFRAASRVLSVLGNYLGVTKAPCPQTIMNWVTRLAIARIDHAPHLPHPQLHADPFSHGFLWIIDTSITLTAGKILAVLALSVRHHDLATGAPSLQSVHCVAVSVSLSWTGDAIAAFLKRLITVLGRPAGFLKDGGTDLARAVRLLGEAGLRSHSIDDISHVIANLLKHQYGKHHLFQTFLSACGKASGKLKQTILACLAPPKVSTKARFMNLHRLMLWAERLLKHSPAGGAAKGSLIAKLRASMDQLPACKSFIQMFLRDSTALLKCQKLLKTKGLSYETIKECEALIKVIPSSSSVHAGFMRWMKRQLEVAEALGVAETGLPISSDPIESLFGVAKRLGVSETKDVNRIAARLPALCGQVTKEDAQRVLGVGVAQQKEVEGSLCSLTKQRWDILPNPGRLENVIRDADEYLELIPGAKNRSKNTITLSKSDFHTETNGPANSLEDRAMSPPEGRPEELALTG